MISILMSIHLRTLCLKKISARYAREKIPPPPKNFLARFARHGCPYYRARLGPETLHLNGMKTSISFSLIIAHLTMFWSILEASLVPLVENCFKMGSILSSYYIQCRLTSYRLITMFDCISETNIYHTPHFSFPLSVLLIL